MGAVYKAVDEALNRMVAVKIMHSGEKDGIGKERFQREAATIARLDHPGITRIYSFGEYDDQPFFVMELIEGRSVKDFVNRCRTIHLAGNSPQELLQSGYILPADPLAPFFLQDPLENPVDQPQYAQKVRTLMTSAASALAEAHERGVIHRDIKSSNLLIVNDQLVKIIDFGLVKQKGDKDITRTDQFMGTLTYAAPEQLKGSRGRVSPATDVYGFGVVLYELATLRHPINEDDAAAIVTEILRGEFTPPRQLNPGISSDFERLICKCLSVNPDDRFRDGRELHAALLGQEQTTTWFSTFTEMLKGWFQKEKPAIAEIVREPLETQTSASLVAKRYFKSARIKFFKNFAILEAIEDLKHAIEIEPRNVDILFLLCFAFNAMGQGSEIRNYLQRFHIAAAGVTEKDQAKLNLLKIVFVGRDYDEGHKLTTRMNQVYPDDLDFLFAGFFCLEALGNYPEAILAGENLARALPDNNIIAVAQSECYFSIMDFTRAEEVLRTRVAEFPDYHNLRLKIIQAKILCGRFDQAELEIKDALKKDPMNMLLQFYFGRILALNNKYERAYAAFRQAVSVPGDDGLRASGYYYLYRLMNTMNRPEQAQKFLNQARDLRKNVVFPSFAEARSTIDNESLAGIADELNHPDWLSVACKTAGRICLDSLDVHTFSIGNYGCTSILLLQPDGTFAHHAIFSNFNLNDNDELFTQLWLPEYPITPFIDQAGNILTCKYHEIRQPVEGGIASLNFVRPWRAGTPSFIYCRFADGKIDTHKGRSIFVLPPLPMPACRHQGFLLVVPQELRLTKLSSVPDAVEKSESSEIQVFYPYLCAGEKFSFSAEVKT